MGVERITVTLTSEMAETVKSAVASGSYASSSEIVREALRDWGMKQLIHQRELEALKKDVEKGLEDIKQGRVRDFDPARITAKGKKRLKSSK